MTNTTAAKTASIAATAGKARERGLASLREEEVYYLSRLAETACVTAGRLLRQVGDDAFRCVDRDGAALDWDKFRCVLDEAYVCLTLALSYVYDARLGCVFGGRSACPS